MSVEDFGFGRKSEEQRGRRREGKNTVEWDKLSTKKPQFTVKILGGTFNVKSVL